MMSDTYDEDGIEGLVTLRGWGGSYAADPQTGRVASKSRVVVDTRGRARKLAGVELAQSGPARSVTLCWRGVRRSFSQDAILRLIAQAQ